MKTSAAIILSGVFVIACSAAQDASIAPIADASILIPPASSSLQQTQTASNARPTATVPPTPAPSAAPFEWGTSTRIVGLGGVDGLKFEYARGAYVAAEIGNGESRIWASGDATHWDAVASVNGVLWGLVAGGPGFVVVGSEDVDADADGSLEDSRAIVLTSVDGRTWRRLSDQRFEHAGINYVGRSRQGLVAFGYTRGGGPSIWTSPDGIDWIKATNDTGLSVAKGVQSLFESDGRLTAFVIHPGASYDESGPVEIWQTEGRAEWERVGELPDPSDAHVHRAAFGGGRWLALGVSPNFGGKTGAWTSADGAQWTRVTGPGDGCCSALVGWTGGLIAAGSTGSAPGDTCGGNEPWVGRTWLWRDGVNWQALPPTDGAAIAALLVVDDRIVGIGSAIKAGGSADGSSDPVLWTAMLPLSPIQPAPTPSPTSSPTPRTGEGGCGG